MRQLMVIFFVAFCFTNVRAQQDDGWKNKMENAAYIHSAIKEVTDVMVHDIYSPPVAARTYAYSCIAGYEAALPGNSAFHSLAGQLHGLTSLPKPIAGKEYSYALAAVQAILGVGKTMVVSEEKITEFYEGIMKEFKSQIPADVYDNSLAYGKEIANAIIDWAALDNYKQTRTFSKYSPTNDAASWKPTPPAYMKAIEPHWDKIRPFVIDSAQQFKPARPTMFSADSNSQFYREALAVRDTGMHLSEEQIQVANFWDCNPFKLNVNGHVMFASKKISPGGHWMNITRLACQLTNAGLVPSLEAYACSAITISDAFVSCWDEKYRSKVIRPETYINKYIDESWLPLLQTPPFPEYTSGHSVISTACAEVLSKIFGDHFSYTDSTEVEFGIPVRHFASFKQAAAEAAISRFYGGIHYMPSINNGVEEGKLIGLYMTQKLKTKNL